MGEQAEVVSRGGVALLASIRKYLTAALAERAQLLGRRLRESTGADPTVAFLENGSASGGSGSAPTSP
jgi:hypothetical protein